MRFSRFFLLLLFVSSSAAVYAASPPGQWSAEDYPAEPTRWYSVEVARFPSPLLANAVAEALKEEGWAPVFILDSPSNNSLSVMIGHFNTPSTGHFAEMEIRNQDLSDTKLLEIERPEEVIEFAGPLSKPYDIGLERWEDGQVAKADKYIKQLKDRVVESPPMPRGIQTSVRELTKGWLEEDIKDPNVQMIDGALDAIRFLWDVQDSPDLLLFLSTQVASGHWLADASQASGREKAEEVAFQMIYGHMKDWHRAWLITTSEINAPDSDEKRKALNLLRQAGLMIQLIQDRRTPRPTIPDVRARLRQAYEICPEEETELLARIELFYLQSFAWEGRWDRVEEIGRAMVYRLKDNPAAIAYTKVWLARSLMRYNDPEPVKELLTSIEELDISRDDFLRYGFKELDPYKLAESAMEEIPESSEDSSEPEVELSESPSEEDDSDSES